MAAGVDRGAEPSEPGPRPLWLLALLGGLAAVMVAGFTALGLWQVQRLGWKLDLIERIEARVRAEPLPLPPQADWAAPSVARDEYRRVRLEGRFRHDLETPVMAVTEAGAGFWILTPLELPSGEAILVNRGFVPPELRDRVSRQGPEGEVEITGLMRMSEPGGGFLRHNDPAADRWFSRDVEAIAAARGISDPAPWFVDAEAGAPGQFPQGGLTVLSFRNNHLVYALTWFALAFGVAFAAWWVARYERRKRLSAALPPRPKR